MDDYVKWRWERWLGRYCYGASVNKGNWFLGVDVNLDHEKNSCHSVYFGFIFFQLHFQIFSKDDVR